MNVVVEAHTLVADDHAASEQARSNETLLYPI